MSDKLADGRIAFSRDTVGEQVDPIPGEITIDVKNPISGLKLTNLSLVRVSPSEKDQTPLEYREFTNPTILSGETLPFDYTYAGKFIDISDGALSENIAIEVNHTYSGRALKTLTIGDGITFNEGTGEFYFTITARPGQHSRNKLMIKVIIDDVIEETLPVPSINGFRTEKIETTINTLYSFASNPTGGYLPAVTLTQSASHTFKVHGDANRGVVFTATPINNGSLDTTDVAEYVLPFDNASGNYWVTSTDASDLFHVISVDYDSERHKFYGVCINYNNDTGYLNGRICYFTIDCESGGVSHRTSLAVYEPWSTVGSINGYVNVGEGISFFTIQYLQNGADEYFYVHRLYNHYTGSHTGQLATITPPPLVDNSAVGSPKYYAYAASSVDPYAKRSMLSDHQYSNGAGGMCTVVPYGNYNTDYDGYNITGNLKTDKKHALFGPVDTSIDSFGQYVDSTWGKGYVTFSSYDDGSGTPESFATQGKLMAMVGDSRTQMLTGFSIIMDGNPTICKWSFDFATSTYEHTKIIKLTSLSRYTKVHIDENGIFTYVDSSGRTMAFQADILN